MAKSQQFRRQVAGQNPQAMAPEIRNRESRLQNGFSLLELLIVITVILILAALAIPHFMRARAAANTAAAEATVRTIQAAEILYSVTYDTGFSPSLKSLGGLPGGSTNSGSAGLIDELLASGEKAGYTYTYIPGPAKDGKISDFEIVAIPVQPCISGLHAFVVSASRGNTPDSSEIQTSDQAFGTSTVFAMTGTANCDGGQ